MKVSTYFNPDFLRRYEERVIIHWLSPYPQIINLLGDVRGKKILDIGCGPGDLIAKLAQMGANATGVDISGAWIELCRPRHIGIDNLRFFRADATNLSIMRGLFAAETFDAVILNLVLPNIPTLGRVEKIFRNIARVLKPSGTLVFSDLHSACKMNASTPPRYIKYGKNFSYFRDGSRYTAGIQLQDGGVIEFQNVHWTFETYTCLLAENVMYISRIVESSYDEDAPQEFRNLKFPEYILFECKRI